MSIALFMRMASNRMLAGKVGFMASISTNVIAATANIFAGGINVSIVRSPELK